MKKIRLKKKTDSRKRAVKKRVPEYPPKTKFRLQELKASQIKIRKENEALKQSQKVYRELFLDAADCIYTLDLKGKVLSVNEAVIKSLKTTRKEALGSDMSQWMTPESMKKARKFMIEVIKGKDYENKSVVLEIIRKDGKHVWFEHKARTIKDKNNNVIGIHGIGRDITEGKLAEESLKRSNELQGLINSLLLLSLEKISLKDLLIHSLDLMLKSPMFSFESKGAIFLLEDEKSLRMIVQKGMPEELRKICAKVPLGKCYCGRAAKERKVKFSSVVDERHEIAYEGILPHGHYCVPIIFSGKVWGVLATYLKEGYSFRESDEIFLIAISNVLAVIIERKQMEKELFLKEEQYRKQFEEATDAIFLADTKTGILLDCNIAAALLVEREKKEIIGMHQSQLHVSKDKVDGVTIEFKKHIIGDSSELIEDKVITKSGKIKDVAIKGSKIILNGQVVLQGIFRDITESKLLQAKLEKILIDLKLAQCIAHVGSWSWDQTNDIVTWSEELYRITGTDPKDFIPTFAKLSALYTPESWQRLQNVVEKALSDGTPYELELEMVKPSGEHRWTLALGQVISDSQEQSKGLFGVVLDITERKLAQEVLQRDKDKLEEMVRERTKELVESQQKLEDSMRLSDIGMLASTIAHELRNPLGVIRTAVYNINKKKKDTSLDAHLSSIDKKVVESEQIIRNLLGYSRIKMPNYTGVDIADILNTCLSQCKDKYAEWNVPVKTTFKNSKEKNIIEADPLHMTELCLNILDNAYQAFPGKSGTIEIIVDYDIEANKLNMVFRDNGVGIKDTEIVHLYEPFFTTKAKGIGLGLTVCKQVVELHNGTINIKSESGIGKGAVVFVTLPIKKNQF